MCKRILWFLFSKNKKLLTKQTCRKITPSVRLKVKPLFMKAVLLRHLIQTMLTRMVALNWYLSKINRKIISEILKPDANAFTTERIFTPLFKKLNIAPAALTPCSCRQTNPIVYW